MRDEHGTTGRRPVIEGQVYDVTITDIGERGDGIGKIDGLVIIVPDATPGENVKVRITRVERKVAFGRKA
jgi:23S rRNA (uracil1939-C5)-methyltransferase